MIFSLFTRLVLALAFFSGTAQVLAFAAQMPQAAPQTVVVLGNDVARVSLTGKLAWLKDDSAHLSVEEVRASAQFAPLPQSLSAGFTQASIWLRADLVSTSAQPTDWILEVDNPLLDDVRFYLPGADGSYVEQRSGEDVSPLLRSVDYRSPAFRLSLGAHASAQVFLRVMSRNAVSATITLWNPAQFETATRDEAFNFGVVFGIYSLLIAFHIVFWYATRERLAAWYIPYVIFNFVTAAISAGYVQRLTGMPGPQSDLVLGLMICLSLGVANTFALLQLQLDLFFPRLTRHYLRLMWALGIVAGLAVLLGQYGLGVGAVQAVSMICIVVLVSVGVRLAWQGHGPARFFLFAFGIFYVAVTLRYLRNLGVLPPMALTEYSIPIGSLLHMIVMSLGIIGKYNQIKRENLAAQTALSTSLEGKVKERTTLLESEILRRKESEEKMRLALDVEQQARQEQQDFVAMVSHEFRTPLAIINTVTQQIAISLDSPISKNGIRCTDIRDATKRMSDMMDEFLNLDRLGNNLRLHMRHVNPTDLLQSIADEFDNTRLVADYASMPEEVTCDAELLRIAVRNLVSNALRYSPDGSLVQLHASGHETGRLEITVENEGPGIASDEVPKIFQKYFRGRSAQTQPGAGLGLYLVERIAHALGGSVRFDGSPSSKCRFILLVSTRAT